MNSYFEWRLAFLAVGILALVLAGLLNAVLSRARHAAELAEKLAAQASRLSTEFDRQRQTSEQQAASNERRRVLQDMHDGIGHELLSALRVAQRDETPRAELAEQIQRALDHLKLTVDSLQEGAEDLSTLLGTLRYRLEPRLRAAGIEIDWRVEAIPTLTGWDSQNARDLQLLLYEAFSNLLAHSGASRTRFEARFDSGSGRVGILLADNGRGLSAAGFQGQGIRSMHSRANRLRADLSLSSASVPGYAGACVALSVPEARSATGSRVSGSPAGG